MSIDGSRSALRAIGFERLEASNTILMGVTRVRTRKKARSHPISVMWIASARCCSGAAPIAVKRKFWPRFFCGCVSNFHRCGCSLRRATSNGSAKSARNSRALPLHVELASEVAMDRESDADCIASRYDR